MYHGKHAKREKMKNNKKMIVLLIALLLILTVGVGSTLAFLITETTPVTNTFTPSTVKGEVYEPEWTNGNTVKSNVIIQNTGDTKAYIRATVVITWQDSDGNIYGVAPVRGQDYTIEYGSGWRVGSDGYYYYPSTVEPLSSTTNLIDRCTVIGSAPKEGYALHVEVLAQGIQSVPTDAVTEAWGVTVADNGTISK